MDQRDEFLHVGGEAFRERGRGFEEAVREFEEAADLVEVEVAEIDRVPLPLHRPEIIAAACQHGNGPPGLFPARPRPVFMSRK